MAPFPFQNTLEINVYHFATACLLAHIMINHRVYFLFSSTRWQSPVLEAFSSPRSCFFFFIHRINWTSDLKPEDFDDKGCSAALKNHLPSAMYKYNVPKCLAKCPGLLYVCFVCSFQGCTCKQNTVSPVYDSLPLKFSCITCAKQNHMQWSHV